MDDTGHAAVRHEDLALIVADVLSRHRPDRLLPDRCVACSPYGHFDVTPDPVPWPCPTAQAAMRAGPTIPPSGLSPARATMNPMSDSDRPDDTPINLDEGGNADWLRLTAQQRREKERTAPPDQK